MNDKNKSIWICSQCARERLYKWPDLGSVARTIAKCDFCDAYGVCFDVDDLEFLPMINDV